MGVKVARDKTLRRGRVVSEKPRSIAEMPSYQPACIGESSNIAQPEVPDEPVTGQDRPSSSPRTG